MVSGFDEVTIESPVGSKCSTPFRLQDVDRLVHSNGCPYCFLDYHLTNKAHRLNCSLFYLVLNGLFLHIPAFFFPSG